MGGSIILDESGNPYCPFSIPAREAMTTLDDKGDHSHVQATEEPLSDERHSAGSSLDLQAAYISQAGDGTRCRDAPSIVLPHQDANYISHIALDIGGSLIKLIYFSPEEPAQSGDNGHHARPSQTRSTGGKLHFVKFETSQVQQCMDFIQAKGLHHHWAQHSDAPPRPTRVKATGGGAFKYAELFEQKLGLLLEKEDEMDCLVGGCNFLLKAIRHEAFTYINNTTNFIAANADSDLYPYLLVNIGSGVSMLQVAGDGQYERVSGSNLGGGTFWGLCRLLTRCRGFDEMLELSMRGDNAKVDMLVGDIYGKDRDYSNIGLSATTIASSFGKVVAEGKDLEDLDPADLALALCRMVSYNIGHLAYLNAKRYGLQRVFFGGFFIRGHPYTMETISFAIKFWSKGEMSAMFLRHEGFLGAVGAFLKVHPLSPAALQNHTSKEPRKVRARFVERFAMGAPFSGGEVHGPAFNDMAEKVDWVENFVRVGTKATEAARNEHDKATQTMPHTLQQRAQSLGHAASLDGVDIPMSPTSLHMNLHVGVLHFNPSYEPFPLLEDPLNYQDNTLNIHEDMAELDYWLGVLEDQIRTAVEKAISSSDGSRDTSRRAAAYGRAMAAHFSKLRAEPNAYGQVGLAELFEMREECLREFGFADVYRLDKERENAAALEVLPDLLKELDAMDPKARLTSLIQGALAGNIFDWGARATVDLYHDGTILEIYRKSRAQLSKRPWRVDDLDALAGRWFSHAGLTGQTGTGVPKTPWKRVIMFVDNAGADIMLGMLPLARELLRMGAEVVLVGNALPAINDITATELQQIITQLSELCPVIKGARAAALEATNSNGGRIPPFPGLRQRIPSSTRLSEMGSSAVGSPGTSGMPAGGDARGQPAPASRLRHSSGVSEDGNLMAGTAELQQQPEATLCRLLAQQPASMQGLTSERSSTELDKLRQPGAGPAADAGRLGEKQTPSALRSNVLGEAKLYVVSNGQGSPTLDLRRIPDTLADATVGADLVVIEGMGRAIHTNLNTRFKCDCLKIAMIKNQHLAAKLFGGNVYDCVCKFEMARQTLHR